MLGWLLTLFIIPELATLIDQSTQALKGMILIDNDIPSQLISSVNKVYPQITRLLEREFWKITLEMQMHGKLITVITEPVI